MKNTNLDIRLETFIQGIGTNDFTVIIYTHKLH